MQPLLRRALLGQSLTWVNTYGTSLLPWVQADLNAMPNDVFSNRSLALSQGPATIHIRDVVVAARDLVDQSFEIALKKDVLYVRLLAPGIICE